MRNLADVLRDLLDVEGVALVQVDTLDARSLTVTLDQTVFVPQPSCVVCGGLGCEFCPKVASSTPSVAA